MFEVCADRSLWGGLNNPALAVAEADVVILGVPFDGAVSYRKGASQGPARVRDVSYHIPPTTEDGELLTGIRVLDLGDVEVGGLSQQAYFSKVEAAAVELFGRTLPFFLGGDHSITIPILKAASRVYQGPIGIIHLDAHLDLCEELEGNSLSHGCTHRRAIEFPNIELENIHFVGIRSFEVQELEFLKDKWPNIYTAREVHRRGVEQVAQEICEKLELVKHVYITLDIDFLEPGLAPGTGTPKAGGFTSRDMLEFLRAFARLPLIGMDVVEVAPPLDSGDVTSFVAQRAITEMWGYRFLPGEV